MSIPITEKLIQRQINNWNRLREFLPDRQEPDPAPVGPLITISRMAGSGGRMLAKSLAERLGLQLHDRSIVEKIARDKNLEAAMIAELDEAASSQARLWVRGVLNQKIFMRDQYHTALVKVVTGLAAQGGSVFLGRGANHILGTNADLRVRLVASLGTRMNNMLERSTLSRAEARNVLEETDRQRNEYIRKVFREEPGKPENYDLVLNSDRMSAQNQVEMVLLALLGQQTKGMSHPAESDMVQGKAAKS